MRVLLCALALALMVVVSGCAIGVTPSSVLSAPLMIEVGGPVAMGDTAVASTKVGRSRAEGIIMFSYGDASITAAAADGDITRIHHVDSLSGSFFGIYAFYETVVYGE